MPEICSRSDWLRPAADRASRSRMPTRIPSSACIDRALPARDAHLLDLDRGARGLELLLRLVRHFLGDLLQDRLRRAVYEILGFLQPETRERANLLDDL